ncbi:MAG TPA: hypothetical protein VHE79_10260, partial [Spirochaetia bacterium]
LVVFVLGSCFASTRAGCSEIRAGVDTALRDETVTRLTLTAGPARLSVRTAGLEEIVAGFVLGQCAVGPLAPLGLLREAANPLGFAAGSEVFLEPAGCALDMSLGSSRMGALCPLVPGTLDAFSLGLSGGGSETGIVARLRPGPGATLEAFVAAAEPPPDASAEEWLFDHAPYPGGSLVDAAARVRATGGGLSFVASVGGSAGERVAPGGFFHLLVTAEGDGVSLALLGGAASRSYRTPAGRASDDEALVAGTLSLRQGRVRAEASFTHAQGFAPFAPAGSVPSRDGIELELRRDLAAKGKSRASLSISGRKTVRWDEGAHRDESGSFSATARGRLGKVDLDAELSLSDGEGLGTSLVGRMKPWKDVTCTAELALDRFESAKRTVTARLTVRHSFAGGFLAVETGVEKWPLVTAPADPWECCTCAVSWSTREWLGE